MHLFVSGQYSDACRMTVWREFYRTHYKDEKLGLVCFLRQKTKLVDSMIVWIGFKYVDQTVCVRFSCK